MNWRRTECKWLMLFQLFPVLGDTSMHKHCANTYKLRRCQFVYNAFSTIIPIVCLRLRIHFPLSIVMSAAHVSHG